MRKAGLGLEGGEERVTAGAGLELGVGGSDMDGCDSGGLGRYSTVKFFEHQPPNG